MRECINEQGYNLCYLVLKIADAMRLTVMMTNLYETAFQNSNLLFTNPPHLHLDLLLAWSISLFCFQFPNSRVIPQECSSDTLSHSLHFSLSFSPVNIFSSHDFSGRRFMPLCAHRLFLCFILMIQGKQYNTLVFLVLNQRLYPLSL